VSSSSIAPAASNTSGKARETLANHGFMAGLRL
jgi:hypothetical protein